MVDSGSEDWSWFDGGPGAAGGPQTPSPSGDSSASLGTSSDWQHATSDLPWAAPLGPLVAALPFQLRLPGSQPRE